MKTNTSNSVLEMALAYVGAGLSVIPVKTDGSKKPLIPWKEFQSKRLAAAQIQQMFSENTGIAIVAGRVSGNLEILDFEDIAPFDNFARAVEAQSPGLLAKLPIVKTPSGGRHIYYRCSLIGPNTRLAEGSGQDKREVLIETRGQGGYVIAPGSPAGCHHAHIPYALVQGDLCKIPEISREQRELLIGLAKTFDRTAANTRSKQHSENKRHQKQTDQDDELDDDDVICMIEESTPLLSCAEVTARCVAINKRYYEPFHKTMFVFTFKVTSPEEHAGAYLPMYVRLKPGWITPPRASKLFKAALVAMGPNRVHKKITRKMFLNVAFRCRTRSVGEEGATYTIIDHLLERVDS